MNKELITELGKEFWGILLFETNLKALYFHLELDRLSISLMTFANWVVFPDQIPADIRQTIRKKLVSRHQTEDYSNLIATVEQTDEEQKIHDHTNELIHFKYNNRITSTHSYRYLYQLSLPAFEKVLQEFQNTGFADSSSCFKYYLCYKDKQKGEM